MYIYAPLYDNQGNEVDKKCPFCRTPEPYSDEEIIERTRKRAELNDPLAIYNIGCCYRDGVYGYPQDYSKAIKFYHRAGELVNTNAYLNIGALYYVGKRVKVDKKKAIHYYELAAMGGNEVARHNLGVDEERKGNMERALRHHIIAAHMDMQLKKITQMHCNLIKRI